MHTAACTNHVTRSGLTIVRTGSVRAEYLKLADLGTSNLGSKYYSSRADQFALASSPAETNKLLRTFKDPESWVAPVSSVFTSPEQFQSAKRYGPDSNPFANDVWSIGQILFLMVVGRMPEETPLEIQGVLYDKDHEGHVPDWKTSPGCKAAITAMPQYEADRVTIQEVWPARSTNWSCLVR